MHKGRLEAFSDGVIAVIITIMVLELKVPTGDDTAALIAVLHPFIIHALSFIFVGIYWNNHHHMFQAVHHVNGRILWANMHLLFWLSLIPFATGWMGEHGFAPVPVATYGAVLFFSAIAYFLLAHSLASLHGEESKLALAFGKDFKGKASLLIYAISVVMAFVNPWVAYACYAAVAVMWLIPDRRIEKILMK